MKQKQSGKVDVVGLGELLIDFTQNGLSRQGNWIMEANPGGGQPNTLAMLNQLGHKTSFIGKVGDDIFGLHLKEVLDDLGIGTENLVFTKTCNTTLAFVHTGDDGDRDFSFYRNLGADTALSADEIQTELITQSRILHYGSLSMTNEPANTATEYALDIAHKNGVLCSFDPNLRPPLWTSLQHAKERILFGLSRCGVLKIAQEELEFITDCKSIPEGVAALRKKYDIALISVTMGKKGSMAFFSGKNCIDGLGIRVSVPAFTGVKTLDTTGAGDTFGACVLHEILEQGYDDFTQERLYSMLVFANAAAALVTTKKGALRVMPSKKEILNLIAQN